jgi:hypothetical protein
MAESTEIGVGWRQTASGLWSVPCCSTWPPKIDSVLSLSRDIAPAP